MRFQPFRRPGAPIGSSRQPETSMRRSTRRGRGKGPVVLLALTIAAFRVEAQYAQAQDLGARYPTMAPIAQYRMDRNAEITLARTAAPVSISRDAEILVLGEKNFEVAVPGKNGFVCVVGRAF